MAAAITARSGSGTIVKAQTAVHIEITGTPANILDPLATVITAISEADPTQVTSASHGLTSGETVVITGSDSVPSIDGEQVVTVLGATTFTVPVEVTTAGTTGTVERTSGVGGTGEDIGTEKRYYVLVDAPGGVDDGRSHVFQTSSDGKHTWDDYIFPAAGSYTLRLRDMLDDSDAATAAVTVAAS